MRAHGVQHWPDPLPESDPGQPDTPGFPRDMPDVNQNAHQRGPSQRRRVSDRTRTGDRLDHNQELYQLSYAHRGALNLSAAS
jgi:hypothetical protein